jgi:hypothetical protein
MRYLDANGKIAWKASRRFWTMLADAERDATWLKFGPITLVWSNDRSCHYGSKIQLDLGHCKGLSETLVHHSRPGECRAEGRWKMAFTTTLLK